VTQPRRDPAASQRPVLIVDDDPEYCAFVSDHLSRAGYPTERGSSAGEAIAFVRSQRPAAVLLEVVLSEATGYEICHELREQYGDALPIVFVSRERTSTADRVAGLLVGGDDYMLKPTDPDELVARVRRLVAKSAAQADPMPRRGASELTKRELEVLRLLADGLDQATITSRLVISPATVGSHIQRILKKLGVHSRTQAVAVAYQEGMIEQG
jgi:two-component system nitrate/nitrite response regulator NarL